MTKLLERVIAEVSKLPEAEQDAIAAWLLEELESERRWEKSLGDSHSVLESLAEEALDEHRLGRSQELDPDKL